MLVSFSQITLTMRENRRGASNLCWEGWWWKRVERLPVERATSTTQKTPSAASSSRSRRGSSRTCITHTWGRQWSFFYSNRNCCQCLTYYTAQSPPWELFWTTKEWLIIHMSFISRLIESLYFICTLKNAVGSRSFVGGIASPTVPHTSHLSFISHTPYLVALESLHHVWKGYYWGCSSRLTWSLPISDLKSWCYYNKRRKRVHVIHWVCWS